MSIEQSTQESIEEKLESFLEMLEDSEKYQRFIDANRQLEDDEEAMALLEEFQQKQSQLQDGFDRSVMQELQDIKQEMSENGTIQQHKAAQEEFVELLRQTDEVITEKIGRKFAQSTGGGCC